MGGGGGGGPANTAPYIYTHTWYDEGCIIWLPVPFLYCASTIQVMSSCDGHGISKECWVSKFPNFDRNGDGIISSEDLESDTKQLSRSHCIVHLVGFVLRGDFEMRSQKTWTWHHMAISGSGLCVLPVMAGSWYSFMHNSIGLRHRFLMSTSGNGWESYIYWVKTSQKRREFLLFPLAKFGISALYPHRPWEELHSEASSSWCGAGCCMVSSSGFARDTM